MKKTSALLTLIGLLLTTPSGFAAFPDVPSSHMYHDAINYVQEEGIVQGFADGNYRPNDNIDRAAFVKIIVEARFKREDIDTCVTRNPYGSARMAYFPDTPAGEWYVKYVCLAKEKGIIQGDFDTKNFRPGDPISAVEALKVIVETFGYNKNNVATAPWYKVHVDILAQKKAIPTSIRNYEHKIKRGEMAEIIYRLLANITDRETQNFFSLE